MNRAQRRASKKAKPTKIRQLYDPLATLELYKPYEPNEVVDYQARLHSLVDRFLKEGEGEAEDFDELVMAINVGVVRAESINIELVNILRTGQIAFMRILQQYKEKKPPVFDANGFQEATAALEVFDAILVNSSRKQMMDALQEVYRRLGKGILCGLTL